MLVPLSSGDALVVDLLLLFLGVGSVDSDACCLAAVSALVVWDEVGIGAEGIEGIEDLPSFVDVAETRRICLKESKSIDSFILKPVEKALVDAAADEESSATNFFREEDNASFDSCRGSGTVVALLLLFVDILLVVASSDFVNMAECIFLPRGCK